MKEVVKLDSSCVFLGTTIAGNSAVRQMRLNQAVSRISFAFVCISVSYSQWRLQTEYQFGERRERKSQGEVRLRPDTLRVFVVSMERRSPSGIIIRRLLAGESSSQPEAGGP